MSEDTKFGILGMLAIIATFSLTIVLGIQFANKSKQLEAQMKCVSTNTEWVICYGKGQENITQIKKSNEPEVIVIDQINDTYTDLTIKLADNQTVKISVGNAHVKASIEAIEVRKMREEGE